MKERQLGDTLILFFYKTYLYWFQRQRERNRSSMMRTIDWLPLAPPGDRTLNPSVCPEREWNLTSWFLGLDHRATAPAQAFSWQQGAVCFSGPGCLYPALPCGHGRSQLHPDGEEVPVRLLAPLGCVWLCGCVVCTPLLPFPPLFFLPSFPCLCGV